MDAVWLERKLKDSDEAAAVRARRITALIDDTIADVRRMAFQLRPGVLDDLGLEAALEILTRDFENRSDISCIFKHAPIPEVSDNLATTLYRIAQEAVTNAVRHSGATGIEVRLFADARKIRLCIEDNGCGFVLEEQTDPTGFGLTGMMERATLAGGKLTIDTAPGRGTCICCNINVERKNHDQGSAGR